MARIDDRLLDRAKRMRREPSPAEAMLWRHVRDRQVGGIKFSRQVVIGHYIADFAARSARLVIELDGDSHAGNEAYDARRTAWLEEQGFRVIRFRNVDVMGNLDGVLETIASAFLTAPHPTLSPEGRGLSGSDT